MYGYKGFSLIELLIAVVGLLAMVTAPSLLAAIRNKHLIAKTNDLQANINLAHRKAITRWIRVILCLSANPFLAGPARSSGDNTWTTGCLLYASGDTNDTFDTATGTLHQIGQPARPMLSIKTNNVAGDNLEYHPDNTTDEDGGDR